MGTQIFEMDEKMKDMILEVMKNVRTQEYTPEMLCEIQKIVDTQYFYYWMNDMKKEELAKEIMEDDMDCYASGWGEYKTTPRGWALNAKYVNSFISSAHMCHNPMIWLQDETHARGIFLFESSMHYLDNQDEHQHYYIYLHDFVKKDDGRWKIKAYRLVAIKLKGEIRQETLSAPEGYEIPEMEEVER